MDGPASLNGRVAGTISPVVGRELKTRRSEPTSVTNRYRDGVLAFVALGAIVVVAAWRGTLSALTVPGALLVGGVGAVLLELLLAWYPDRSAALWENRWVRAASTVGVVVASVVAAFLVPRFLGVLVGGLLAYFVLLGLVLAGVLPGAESWFDR